MLPGKKGRLSPEVIDELMQFVDSQAAQGEAADPGSEEMDNAPSVEVEIESTAPEGMTPSGKVCPTCGHSM